MNAEGEKTLCIYLYCFPMPDTLPSHFKSEAEWTLHKVWLARPHCHGMIRTQESLIVTLCGVFGRWFRFRYVKTNGNLLGYLEGGSVFSMSIVLSRLLQNTKNICYLVYLNSRLFTFFCRHHGSMEWFQGGSVLVCPDVGFVEVFLGCELRKTYAFQRI